MTTLPVLRGLVNAIARLSDPRLSLTTGEEDMTGTPDLGPLGVAGQACSRWRWRFAGLGVVELRRLRQVKEEHRTLKRLVADLTLDQLMLQEAVRTHG
jgi:hypothetical protein